MNITELSPQQLRKAAILKEKIAGLQKELSALLGAQPAAQAPAPAQKKKKKKISAAGIARIRAAQKDRWAKVKAKLAGK